MSGGHHAFFFLSHGLYRCPACAAALMILSAGAANAGWQACRPCLRGSRLSFWLAFCSMPSLQQVLSLATFLPSIPRYMSKVPASADPFSVYPQFGCNPVAVISVDFALSELGAALPGLILLFIRAKRLRLSSPGDAASVGCWCRAATSSSSWQGVISGLTIYAYVFFNMAVPLLASSHWICLRHPAKRPAFNALCVKRDLELSLGAPVPPHSGSGRTNEGAPAKRPS